MSIEGFRSLNQDIETIANRSEAAKKAKKQAVEEDRELTKKEKKERTDEEKEYIDKRDSGGNLWVIGDRKIARAISETQQTGDKLQISQEQR